MLAIYFAVAMFSFILGVGAPFLGLVDTYFWWYLWPLIIIIVLNVHKKARILLVLCLLSLFLGQLRTLIYINNNLSSSLSLPESCFVLSATYTYKKNEIHLTCPGFGKLFLINSIKDNDDFLYGDKVAVEGKISPVYDSVKNKDKFFYQLKGSLSKINDTKKRPLSVTVALFFRRQNVFFDNQIKLIYPEPHASVVSAILLGNKKGIDRKISVLFSNVGISHMMVISGFHIMIISQILIKLFKGLGQKYCFIFTFALLVLFVFLIGPTSSALRALVMAFFLLLSSYSGRDYYPITAILFAASFMIFLNPFILVYDIGFQLSFAAVFGIVYLKPAFMTFFTKKNYLTEIVSVTLSAQLATMPLVVYYFDKISLIGLLANIIIVPLLPFLIITSALSLILFFIISELSFLFGFFSWLILQFIFWFSEKTNHHYLSSFYFNKSFVIFTTIFCILLLKLARFKYEK
jgi:ComEC/Rec2-related protein